MHYDCGGVRYNVVEGTKKPTRLGECDYTNEAIRISVDHGDAHIVQTFAHEAAHVEIYHNPPPDDPESEAYARWLCSRMLSFHRQFTEQGGVQGLSSSLSRAASSST